MFKLVMICSLNSFEMLSCGGIINNKRFQNRERYRSNQCSLSIPINLSQTFSHDYLTQNL